MPAIVVQLVVMCCSGRNWVTLFFINCLPKGYMEVVDLSCIWRWMRQSEVGNGTTHGPLVRSMEGHHLVYLHI